MERGGAVWCWEGAGKSIWSGVDGFVVREMNHVVEAPDEEVGHDGLGRGGVGGREELGGS